MSCVVNDLGHLTLYNLYNDGLLQKQVKIFYLQL